jgi:hypothetical protein
MRCPDCGVVVQLLKSVEGPGEWLHVGQPGEPPYLDCKSEPVTEPIR